MKRIGFVLGFAGLSACAGANEPAPMPLPAAAAQVAPPAPPATAPIPEASGNLPADAAGYASIDPAAFDTWLAQFAATVPTSDLDRLERDLGLQPGSFATGQVLADNGVDPQRPIVVAVSPLQASATSLLSAGLERLEEFGNQGVPTKGFARKLAKSLRAHSDPPAHIRIVFPTTEPEAVLSALRSFLSARGCEALPALEGFSELCASGGVSFALAKTTDLVVMDIHVFLNDAGEEQARDAALHTRRSLAAGPSGSAPALESSAIRIRYRPAKLADVGFVDALGRTPLRIDDWEMLGRLRKAGMVSALAKNRQGAYFEDVDIRVAFRGALPETRVEAAYGPGLQRLDPGACQPSQSVEFPGSLARFDVSTACMRALAVPGDPTSGALSRSSFAMTFRDAHWLGRPVGFAWYPLGLTRTPLHWDAGVGPAAMMRFERFGWSNPAFGQPDVFWGLLPANASQQDIRCSVTESGGACQGARSVWPGRITQSGDAFVRVVKLNDRYVVLSSKDRRAVMAMHPKLTDAPVPSFRATVSKGSMRRFLRDHDFTTQDTRYVGQVDVGSDRLTWIARPSP